MSEIIPLHIEDAEVETIERNETKQHTQEEIMEILKQIQYKEGSLQWINFNLRQPDPDKWFLLYCPMGKIAQNIYVCYRDVLGNYDLPHPTKKFNAQAWAYIENPEIVQ